MYHRAKVRLGPGLLYLDEAGDWDMLPLPFHARSTSAPGSWILLLLIHHWFPLSLLCVSSSWSYLWGVPEDMIHKLGWHGCVLTSRGGWNMNCWPFGSTMICTLIVSPWLGNLVDSVTLFMQRDFTVLCYYKRAHAVYSPNRPWRLVKFTFQTIYFGEKELAHSWAKSKRISRSTE